MGEVIRGVIFGQKNTRGSFKTASGDVAQLRDNNNLFTDEEKISIAALFQMGKTAGLFIDQETLSAKDSFSYTFYGRDSKDTKVLLSVITKEKDSRQIGGFSYKTQYPRFDRGGPLGLKFITTDAFDIIETRLESAILATVSEVKKRSAASSAAPNPLDPQTP